MDNTYIGLGICQGETSCEWLETKLTDYLCQWSPFLNLICIDAELTGDFIERNVFGCLECDPTLFATLKSQSFSFVHYQRKINTALLVPTRADFSLKNALKYA